MTPAFKCKPSDSTDDTELIYSRFYINAYTSDVQEVTDAVFLQHQLPDTRTYSIVWP